MPNYHVPAFSKHAAASNGKPRQGNESEQDLASYPILTEEVSLTSGGQPGPGSAGNGSLGRSVEDALRQVLGWRPRTADPKGFVAALANSFTITPYEGRVNVAWTPRSYASTIQADMGAITGGQASLYARAQTALSNVLPLLDGLVPLTPDPDVSEMESVRAVVRATLKQLVDEFGVLGGPRVARVDQLFQRLRPGEITTSAPGPVTNPAGQLGKLANLFGLNLSFVNTVDDEQDLTNFIIVVDYVAEMQASWTQFRQSFVPSPSGPSGSSAPFFGTQLVLLSRSLAVVGELVGDLRFAMDSVFLGNDERYTIYLSFAPIPEPPADSGDLPLDPSVSTYQPADITVGDLLDWVDGFATTEGRELLEDGGKNGAVAFTDTVYLLSNLVSQASNQSPGNSIPVAWKTPRVQRAIGELSDQLGELYNLASRIASPF